jgi:hypothetical protein
VSEGLYGSLEVFVLSESSQSDICTRLVQYTPIMEQLMDFSLKLRPQIDDYLAFASESSYRYPLEVADFLAAEPR